MSLGAPAFLHHDLIGPHCQLPRIEGTPQSGLRACGLCVLRPGAKDQGWHEMKISNPLSLGQSPPSCSALVSKTLLYLMMLIS